MMKFAGVSRFAFDWKAAEWRVSGGAYLPWFATALATAYLLVALYFSLSAVALNADQSAAEAAAPARTETVAQNAVDLLEIGTWHLFGQSLHSAAGTGSISETQLQLKLLGVLFLSKDTGNASGIIQADDGQQKKYRLGDELPGGAVLQAVEQDRVLLKHGERQESLLLKKDSVRVPTVTE
ncbi:type II secretion system protein N [Methylomonas albis]|uniref:Type II secretion system protein GspC N-terminal domain-containing protein n=1 Tax=Methylomonas albis TaxID=1854563 RepID=A0ABR9CXV5_9GAMM|nr:type II secretion system protein N [Methylomonas albis]MBD9355722.1 hypothetical protein [Methylomonas albis]